MLEVHPSAQDFEDFLGGTSRSAHRPLKPQVLRHLLRDCTVCRDLLESKGWSRERLNRLLLGTPGDSRPEGPPAYDYSRAFAAAEQAVTAFLTPEPRREDVSASVVLYELLALESEDRRARIEDDPSYASPSVVRGLIDHSHTLRYTDAEDMLHFAELARLAAERCDVSAAGNSRRLADLRARAWGQYGNASRVAGKPRQSGDAFTAAQSYQAEGTGDPVLRAWLFEKITPFLIFQGRFQEAIEMADEAARIYRDLGEPHQLASTRTQKAIAEIYAGETERAVRTLNEAIPLIDHEEDPHLLLAACHNLIRCYIDLDRPDQALMIYSEASNLYKEFEDPLILLRAGWQEGQLLRDLGHLRAAETALLKSRKGYLERGLAYEVALVSLDLATVYVKLGSVEQLKQTVASTIPIFRALRVGLETLAALLQLQRLADQEQQALDVIRSINTKIKPLPKQRPIRA
jgi:tetratricopeptide (TPR) repeat protein